MAKIKYWNGSAALIEIYLAPGGIGPEAIPALISNLETEVFRNTEHLPVNAFVKQAVKYLNYHALLAAHGAAKRATR